uniref:Uncharacterized protein n=1 Tax=Panagrolaimus sp. ES5 TaxID=591445 RepID=A0AC34G4K7_9BILA
MYSIYCRSFPEDKDMVEEYKQAVEKFGQIFVPWKNLFYFETFDMNMVLNILKQEKAFKIVKNVISPLTCYFSSENAIRQTFPKKVVELELSKTKILDAGGKKIMLEEILEFTPKITLFSADIVKCNSKTAQIISKLPFVNGIRFFSLLSISDDSLAAEDFAKFIREKVGQCGSVAVTFKRKVDADYVNAFAEICNNTPNPGQQKISIKSV